MLLCSIASYRKSHFSQNYSGRESSTHCVEHMQIDETLSNSENIFINLRINLSSWLVKLPPIQNPTQTTLHQSITRRHIKLSSAAKQ